MKIYHNPRCRKSRETLELIKEHGIDPDVVLYMDNPMKQKELKDILNKLNVRAEDLVRTGEKLYKEEYKGKILKENEWVKVLIENPKLMERPIVVKGDKAIIGRPPENVMVLF